MGRLSQLGETIYPSPTGRRTERIARTPFRRCMQCGQINDTRSTAWSRQGEGLTPADPGSAPSGKVTEQNVTSGCVFCGSLHWQPHKPVKLPEDRFLPTDHIEKMQGSEYE